MPREKFVKKLLSRDKKIFEMDLKLEPVYGDVESDSEIIADFTEYSQGPQTLYDGGKKTGPRWNIHSGCSWTF